MSWKLGLVGCGMMGTRYAKVFGDMPELEIVACADPTPDKLETFRRKSAIRDGYTEYTRMLEEVELDAVLNVTCDPLHIPVLEASLEHGLPVLTEKPLGTTLEECRRLERFSADARRGIAVNFSKRNAGAVRGARELVAAGTLGRIVSVEASYRQGWVLTAEWGDWREKNAWLWRLDSAWSPMGVFSDLGSHLLDLVLYVTGDRFGSLSCTDAFVMDKGIPELKGHRMDSPDRLSAAGRLSKGASVEMITSRVDVDQSDRLLMTVRGEAGALRFDLSGMRHAVELFPTGPVTLPAWFENGESPEPGVWTALPCPKPRNVYEEFATSLAGNATGYPGLTDALDVQAALEAVRTSLDESGRTVRLSELDL